MPDIQILSPHLADLIAAGEVVERPASVVKELVENAFDAGARTVTVELRGGGATYLRVTDDGCGMTPEDAGIAFLRHATSKLHDEQGLEAIGTMGFRGEALAAISAVSHITLTTRQRGAASGTHMTLDAGDIQDALGKVCKFQIALPREARREDFPFELLSFEATGRVAKFIVRGNRDEIAKQLEKLSPLFIEEIPVDFEELFLCEVKARGYLQ